MAPKRVRFSSDYSPVVTKVCASCSHRDMPLRREPGKRRSMSKCEQCGAYECGHCVRFLVPVLCEPCRICYRLTGCFPAFG